MYHKKKYQPIGPAFKKEDWENLKKGGKLAGKNIKKLSLKAKDFYRTQKDITSFNKQAVGFIGINPNLCEIPSSAKTDELARISTVSMA